MFWVLFLYIYYIVVLIYHLLIYYVRVLILEIKVDIFLLDLYFYGAGVLSIAVIIQACREN